MVGIRGWCAGKTSALKWHAFTGGRTKNEATIVETSVRNLLLQGKDPAEFNRKTESATALTVAIVCQKYLDHPKFKVRNEHDRCDIRGKLEGPITRDLGRYEFRALDSAKLYGFYLKLKEQGLANTTLHKYHLLLCQVGDVFTELAPGQENPVRKLKDFMRTFPRQAPTRDINFLTPDELEIVFQAAQKSKSRLLPSFEF